MPRARSVRDSLPIAVIDAETDPGQGQGWPASEGPGQAGKRVPASDRGGELKPFAWGWYDGIEYRLFWGDDCSDQLLSFLAKQRSHQIFAHNGGRFDFQFFTRFLSGKPLIIGNRIVDAQVLQHTVSDSFARVPVALSRFGNAGQGGKLEINYARMAKSERNKPDNRRAIEEYLERDCKLLYKVMFEWIDKYGRKPRTMASAAFEACQKTMNSPPLVKRMREDQDAHFRQFFYGGRVQAFALGVVRSSLTIHDVNSMYPHVMAAYHHPGSANRADWRRGKHGADITNETDFAIIEAWSKGALPLRTEKGLQFPVGYARFYATGHEIRAGLQCERLKIDKVHATFTCSVRTNFRAFVEPRYRLRQEYDRSGNVMMKEMVKLELNGTYGKFAINPRKFKKHIFVPEDERGNYETGMFTMPDGKQRLGIIEGGKIYICENMPDNGAHWRFSCDADNRRAFRNVAIGASITGAARAEMLIGLANAIDPVYCDTDAIAAASLSDLPFSSTDLGAWKLEAEGDEMLIGGKKLYALLGDAPTDPEKARARIELYGDARCVKLASKGGRLNVAQMRHIAMGGEVVYQPVMPTFANDGSQFYQDRVFKITNPHLVQPFPGIITSADLAGKLERIGI